MAVEVKVPPMGESISNGILATWHVKDGDYVERNQMLFELETDKITSEGVADASGIIRLKAEEGDEVDIGTVIALIDDTAEKPESSEEAAEEPKSKESEASEPVEEENAPKPAKAEEKPESKPDTDGESPAVRRIAAETGIDPKSVDGSGKDGRVTKGDMLAAQAAVKDAPKSEPQAPVPSKPAPVSSAAPKTSPAAVNERVTRKRMTSLRKRIAERLVQSQKQAAILTTFNEVDMSTIMQLRKKHQEAFVAKHGAKLGFMSFFVKAVVKALKAVPSINAQIDGQDIVYNHYFDIGVAVGTEKGLVVPVIRNADQKGFAQIEKDILDYAKKARDGKLGIDDLQGGVFTISNGGIYGSMLSTPIINPPQSGILGMHNIQERPMAVDGEVVIRPMMYLALSYDHRLVDGKEAVTFLKTIKDAIEDPTNLLFDL